MEVEATTQAPEETGADAVALALFEGEDLGGSPAGAAAGAESEALRALAGSGEAKAAFQKLAHTHAEGRRYVVVGMGARGELDAERARVAGALAQARARELGARSVAWSAPGEEPEVVGALVEGTLLGAYRFDRYREAGDEDAPLERLFVCSKGDHAETVTVARVLAEAQNAARDLQNTPANDMTPAAMAERARALAGELEGLEVDVQGREALESRGMGAFAAVARGAHAEPALITLRYDGPGADGPCLGFVGKAVTFDTGGISIKPSAKMHEMKFDMSGGAAVLEAAGAIARLRLPVRLVAVIGATENMPSGHATRPGDIVRALNGTTIEVNNTDAEGRLVLADCLGHAIEQGAERLVDLATLTGAIVVALGSTHAGLFASDDGWAAQIEAAAQSTGELVWRLPLHPEYAEMVKGQYADVANVTEARKASSITAAEFLRRFTGDVPWAHVDIAGTAWDVGRPYTGKLGSGFGVRLLVELARRAGPA